MKIRRCNLLVFCLLATLLTQACGVDCEAQADSDLRKIDQVVSSSLNGIPIKSKEQVYGCDSGDTPAMRIATGLNEPVLNAKAKMMGLGWSPLSRSELQRERLDGSDPTVSGVKKKAWDDWMIMSIERRPHSAVELYLYVMGH